MPKRKRAPFESLGGEKFDLILADPPWSYASAGVKGAATNHYNTMTDKQIAELPVEEICEPGAFCLMWATGPKLPEAIDTMRAWGFDYKTVFFVWFKTYKNNPEELVTGLGNYTRSSCEYVLVGRRKDPKQKRLKECKRSTSVKQVIADVRREHSRKPDVTFDLIDQFFQPELKRVELFARQARPGWKAWGNETDKFNDSK